MQEAADQIRKHYRDLGFIEREVFNVGKDFNWENFTQAGSNLSLFSQQKIIELRLGSAKLEAPGKQALHQYLEAASPDILVLISSPKLEAAAINSKWFKQIETQGALVQIWPISRDNLDAWLAQRLIQSGINADGEALRQLAEKVEGNLLAAMQEIEKLKLLANSAAGESINLDAQTVMQVVADSSRYSVYHLLDAALLGDTARAQKMLASLQQEGTYPLVILGAIARELRSLLPMLEKKEQGQGINAIVQSARVWFNRKQAVANILRRISTDEIWQLLEQVRHIDQSIKGMSNANPWDELSLMLLKLSGCRTASMIG
jgi:DNA polymerase-3 subunit delta